jgi:CubicO group peptidase (beta-lactamase class C family)
MSATPSTARDLAAFFQMLINRGSYGGRQILSRASVTAMTRNQVDDSIPAIMPMFRDGKNSPAGRR